MWVLKNKACAIIAGFDRFAAFLTGDLCLDNAVASLIDRILQVGIKEVDGVWNIFSF